MKQANRTKAADRWAGALTDLDLQAPAAGDDAAWSRLAQNLGERKGYTPSADTRALIAERLRAKGRAAFEAAKREGKAKP